MKEDKKIILKRQYNKLYLEVEQILFRHNPIGINFETNSDEYDPEVNTILPRLKDANNEEDVLNIVYEEFIKWFDPETTGAKDSYKEIANEIWTAW